MYLGRDHHYDLNTFIFMFSQLFGYCVAIEDQANQVVGHTQLVLIEAHSLVFV